MGDELTMPDGSVFRFLERPEDPETGPLLMEFELAPDCGAPPPHLHPGGQRETFECTGGSFELLLGREWRSLDAGDSLTVAPGTRHTFRNRSGAVARVRNVHAPAHSFETYLRRLHALATETGATSARSPAVAARFALLWREHADTIAPADAPIRIAIAVLAAAARLLGAAPPAPTP